MYFNFLLSAFYFHHSLPYPLCSSVFKKQQARHLSDANDQTFQGCAPKTLCHRRILRCILPQYKNHFSFFLRNKSTYSFSKLLFQLIKKRTFIFKNSVFCFCKKTLLILQQSQQITFLFLKYPFIACAQLKKNVPFNLSRLFFFCGTKVPRFFQSDVFVLEKGTILILQ